MDLANLDLPQIVILVIALAVVWIVVRTVLKLAVKVLATGCALIVLLGLVLAVLNLLR